MSTPEWKTRCSLLAECVNEWRILPRGIMIAYAWFVWNTTDRLLTWYFALPAVERTMESAGLAAGIFTAIVGFGTPIMNFYIKTEQKRRGQIDDDST